MRGPAGDAVFVVIFILIIALVTIKIWYPPLMRLIHNVRKDLQDVEKWHDSDSVYKDHHPDTKKMTQKERLKYYDSIADDFRKRIRKN